MSRDSRTIYDPWEPGSWPGSLATRFRQTPVPRWSFRPHYMAWSEQQRIEFQYLKNVIRIITETGLRVYKELAPMRKEQVDFANGFVWLPDSKIPNGIAEVQLTDLALEAFRSQMQVAGHGPWLFPSDANPPGYQVSFKKVWSTTLRKAG